MASIYMSFSRPVSLQLREIHLGASTPRDDLSLAYYFSVVPLLPPPYTRSRSTLLGEIAGYCDAVRGSEIPWR